MARDEADTTSTCLLSLAAPLRRGLFFLGSCAPKSLPQLERRPRKAIDVSIHVDDLGAFTPPWNAKQRFRRVKREWERGHLHREQRRFTWSIA
jgi:hypothetical protein